MTAPIRKEDVVRETLAEAWDLFQNDFVLYILAGLLTIVVSVVSLGLLSGVVSVGFVELVEKRRRGEEGYPTDVFDGFSHLGECLVASVLIGVGILIGLFLFVLPGLLFGLAMLFTYPAIAIDNETATGAMARSLSIITENFALAAMFLVIVVVLSSLGGAVVFGALLVLPFNLVLLTLAYHRLNTV
jgi:hypothetical protein